MLNVGSFFIFCKLVMKKLLRRLIIFIVIVCAYLLIKQKTTRLGTTIQTGDVAPATGVVITGIDLTNCVSYFDGCNNCTVKDGKADACTLMYCETPSEPKCLQYATGTEIMGVENQQTVYTTDTYIVKTEQTNDVFGWYNIYVYDVSWKVIFSLLQDNDADIQYFQTMTWDYLVMDYGTAPDIRSMAIYDVKSQQLIFDSSYSPQNDQKQNGLYIEGNKLYFATLVFDTMSNQRKITKPAVLPSCSQWEAYSWLTLWYSEIRAFNLETKQLEKTGKLICTFLQ